MFNAIKHSDIRFPEKPEISPEAKSFISMCCKKDPSSRLGTADDFDEIKAHPWF